MDRPLNFHVGLGEPKSFRPNLHSSKSSTGANSDPEKKSRSSKHKSHRHHHDHHEDRHGSSRRHAAKEAVQSAIQIQPPTSFGDLLKQARGSKDGSPGHSRKGSVAQLREDGSVKGSGDSGIAILPPKPVQAEDVERETKRVKFAERHVVTCIQYDHSIRRT